MSERTSVSTWSNAEIGARKMMAVTSFEWSGSKRVDAQSKLD
jgi:hypothetical protein